MIAIATLAGTEKEMSEDAVLAGNDIVINANKLLDIPARGFICVADGVGGNNAGEIASSFVLEALRSYDGSQDLQSFLRDVNHKLLEKSRERADYNQMATTLTGVWINNEAASFLVHVGNTRAYLLQGRYLKQITEDHTYVNSLVKAGVITEEEAIDHENRNMITRAVGADYGVQPDFFSCMVKPGDIVFMCSDGLYDELPEDKIKELLSEDKGASDIASDLVDAANENGGSDNITTIVLKVTEDDLVK